MFHDIALCELKEIVELFYDDEFALFFFLLLKGMRFTSFAALMSATRKGIFLGCKDEFNCLSLNFFKSILSGTRSRGRNRLLT